MPRKRSATPAPSPALPPIRRNIADAMETYLLDHYDIKRPPIAAAQLLALIIELDRINQPFPPRAVAAKAIGCTVFGIDAALSVALSRGLISIDMAVSQGNVMRRDSAIRHKYYRPSPALVAVAHRAPQHTARRAGAS